MIAATVLAAGASTRMGFPKALLDFRGRTFLQSILNITGELGLLRIVALGHDSGKVLESHDLHDVTVVMNEDLQSGPIGSIRASIRALRTQPAEAIMVWPVDFPHVSIDTARELIARFEMGDSPAIVIPEYNGAGGHPVIFGRNVFDELLDAPDSAGARVVVRRDPTRVVRVPVGDAAVVDTVNTPEAYEKILRLADERTS